MLFIVVFLLSRAGAAEFVQPHRLTLCAAALTDPLFDETGRRIDPDEPLPEGLGPELTPLASHVQHDSVIDTARAEMQS